jgi:hypothetical protein
MESEQLYYIYEAEGTGIRSGEADTVWYPSLDEAWEAAINGLDDCYEFENCWAWSGSIKRKAVSWSAIEEAWGEEIPNESDYEKVEADDAT